MRACKQQPLEGHGIEGYAVASHVVTPDITAFGRMDGRTGNFSVRGERSSQPSGNLCIAQPGPPARRYRRPDPASPSRPAIRLGAAMTSRHVDVMRPPSRSPLKARVTGVFTAEPRQFRCRRIDPPSLPSSTNLAEPATGAQPPRTRRGPNCSKCPSASRRAGADISTMTTRQLLHGHSADAPPPMRSRTRFNSITAQSRARSCRNRAVSPCSAHETGEPCGGGLDCDAT